MINLLLKKNKNKKKERCILNLAYCHLILRFCKAINLTTDNSECTVDMIFTEAVHMHNLFFIIKRKSFSYLNKTI